MPRPTTAPDRARDRDADAAPPCRRCRRRRRRPRGPAPTPTTFHESAPLPTRVPGQHLSHHPRVANEAPDAEADPMRAYRVHELLTRHAQGKRRGQAGDESTTVVAATDRRPSAVPDSFGAQEDGR